MSSLHLWYRARLLTAQVQKIVYHHGLLSGLLRVARRGRRVERLLSSLRSVECWYRIEGRTGIGSLALSARPRPEVLLGGGCRLGALVELTRRRHRVLGLPLVPLERVEALAGQIRREAVRRRSGRRQLSPHRMSHGRHVRPRERAAGEQHVPDQGLDRRLPYQPDEEQLFYHLRTDCP